MAIKKINTEFGMKAIQWVDQAVVDIVWLASYDTALKRGLSDSEAAFRASQVIAETQSSSNVADLSSLQRNKTPWVRAMIMFTNDIVQHINQIWFDLPAYVKNKEWRKAIGTLASLAIAGGISLVVGGRLLRRDDDDDDEHRKKLANEILQLIVSDTIPIVGNMVAEGVSGWTGTDMVSLPSAVGQLLSAVSKFDGKKITDEFWDLLEAAAKTSGVPTTAVRRVVKSVAEENPLYLLNAEYARLWEDLSE